MTAAIWDAREKIVGLLVEHKVPGLAQPIMNQVDIITAAARKKGFDQATQQVLTYVGNGMAGGQG